MTQSKLMPITWTGGPSSFPGVNQGYWRLQSDQKIMPPYTWHGQFRCHEIMDPPVFYDGTPAWYSPGINFHPLYPSNDRNIVIGIGGRKNPTGVGISAEMRDVRPERPYGVRTGYASRDRHPIPDPVDGQWHNFRCEVFDYGSYELWLDDSLVCSVVEKAPYTIDPGAWSVGLRLDFCHIEISSMSLEHNYKLPPTVGEDIMYSAKRADKPNGYHISNGLQRRWVTDNDYARMIDAGVTITFLGMLPVESIVALGEPVPNT